MLLIRQLGYTDVIIHKLGPHGRYVPADTATHHLHTCIVAVIEQLIYRIDDAVAYIVLALKVGLAYQDTRVLGIA